MFVIKVLFLAVNSKYIHSSPAVRILTKKAREKFDANFLEFTIKDSVENIVEKIKNYDIIGFSCYIWNITIMKKIASVLKRDFPKIKIFAGGPEVSFEPQNFVENFDYILCGEGEEIILPFLENLQNNENMTVDGVASVDNSIVSPHFTQNLDNVPEIYDMYTEDDLNNRVIYLELSRGCPFNCSYCLSSVEKGVRIFDRNRTESTFEFIESNRFKCIKFLDRTFNINPTRFIEICKRLENTPNIYQFEIEAGLFNKEVIDFLCFEVEPKKFRLEIGIQSFNEKSLKAVNRNQNTDFLIETIKKINSFGRCTIHIDLIAGLPFETVETFKSGFDTAFLLQCEELQLGFLKMLRGTEIRNNSQEYGYFYSQTEPYEIYENKYISSSQMQIIHSCEESLEWLWNKKNGVNLIKHLIEDKTIKSWFDFFVGFFPYLQKGQPLHKNLENLLRYLKDLGIINKDYIDDLKLDYLSKVKVRPKPFWKDFAYEDFKEVKKSLTGKIEINNNAFATSYYNGYLIIEYDRNKPLLLIEKNNTTSHI